MTQPKPESLIAVVQLGEDPAPRAVAAATAQPDFASDEVSPGKQVSLYFSLELDSGELLDSCFGRVPATCSIGDGSLLPDFEKTLYGMHAGETRETLLPPERAFGLPNEANVQRFPRFRFPPDLQLAEGLVVDFADSSGNSQAGVVRSFDSQWVRIDFNHPLAGKTIRFRAEIVAVQPPAAGSARQAQD
jgi:FKBP-type peptidyl-prolyl cis-trans isomerase SlpA